MKRELSLLLAWSALLVVLAFIAPAFFSPGNLRDLVLANAPVLLVAIGMTIIILLGQIDISVGAQFAVASVAAGTLAKGGVPTALLPLVLSVLGAVMGGLNGALVGSIGIPAIVVTLATMVILRDGLRWITGGAWVQDLPASFQWFGLGQTGGQVALVLGSFSLFGLFLWGLKHLALGRAVYAAGADAEAARLSGIPVQRLLLGSFCLMGVLTALAAWLNSIRFSDVQSNSGVGLELRAISAVVVGGVSINGGRGSLAGTLLGVLLLGTIGPALTFLGISAFWEKALQGAIILIAVSLDHLTARRGLMPGARRINQELILLVLIGLEIAVFGVFGSHFFSTANGFEILRLGVELGLLALCLTPVILTGGIDLSVGSLLGLCAVAFGALWRDAHLPLPVAALAAILVGVLGGGLNALLIARTNLPPLIVTLGSYSLYRGLAEGLTGGAENYTGFPGWFLHLGQGYWGGILPPQTLALAAFAVGVYVLVHRTTVGRALSAIGYSPAGARYAGIPVAKRIALVYVLSGVGASVAALIYVAHLGQAKSDAGTGYELMAITAVVLGGTSIFGGRGSVAGTLLGLLAIIIIQNGLRLAALPTELSGILTGLLLLATIGLDTISRRPAIRPQYREEEDDMRNSQVAVLSAVILLGAGIVAASNWWMVNSLRGGSSTAAAPVAANTLTVGMMPKAKGDPYFITCKVGAEEAAKEHGVTLIWDGPTDLDPAKQNEVVEGWITRKVDVIAVSVENQAALSTVLRKARAAGIGVITWDADAAPDARDYFINQATPQGIGYTLTDEAARLLNTKGEFAIVTASLSAANQNEWMKHIKQRLVDKYPQMKLAVVRPSDGDRDRAFAETQTILKVYPNVKLIMGIAAPAVPGAAEAVKQSGRTDVKVIGLSLPSLCKQYVHSGIIDAVVLWNTRDLGYLTVTAAQALRLGGLKPGVSALPAGRLGTVRVVGSEVMLGLPFVFRKDNIDQFDF